MTWKNVVVVVVVVVVVIVDVVAVDAMSRDDIYSSFIKTISDSYVFIEIAKFSELLSNAFLKFDPMKKF